MYTYIHIYTSTFGHVDIQIQRFHTMTDVYTAALLQPKTSSDDNSGLRHGFGAKASLPLMLYTHIINMLIYTYTCSCSITTTP